MGNGGGGFWPGSRKNREAGKGKKDGMRTGDRADEARAAQGMSAGDVGGGGANADATNAQVPIYTAGGANEPFAMHAHANADGAYRAHDGDASDGRPAGDGAGWYDVEGEVEAYRSKIEENSARWGNPAAVAYDDAAQYDADDGDPGARYAQAEDDAGAQPDADMAGGNDRAARCGAQPTADPFRSGTEHDATVAPWGMLAHKIEGVDAHIAALSGALDAHASALSQRFEARSASLSQGYEARIAGLAKELEARDMRNEQLQRMVDEMRDELHRFRNDQYFELLRPALRDMLDIRESMQRTVAAMRDKHGAQGDMPIAKLESFIDDYEEMLNDYEIECYRSIPGDAFTGKKHTCIQKKPTGDRAMHGIIERSFGSGYVYRGRTLLMERVCAYAYDAALDGGAAGANAAGAVSASGAAGSSDASDAANASSATNMPSATNAPNTSSTPVTPNTSNTSGAAGSSNASYAPNSSNAPNTSNAPNASSASSAPHAPNPTDAPPAPPAPTRPIPPNAPTPTTPTAPPHFAT